MSEQNKPEMFTGKSPREILVSLKECIDRSDLRDKEMEKLFRGIIAILEYQFSSKEYIEGDVRDGFVNDIEEEEYISILCNNCGERFPWPAGINILKAVDCPSCGHSTQPYTDGGAIV